MIIISTFGWGVSSTPVISSSSVIFAFCRVVRLRRGAGAPVHRLAVATDFFLPFVATFLRLAIGMRMGRKQDWAEVQVASTQHHMTVFCFFLLSDCRVTVAFLLDF
jgi:hypothetical protein